MKGKPCDCAACGKILRVFCAFCALCVRRAQTAPKNRERSKWWRVSECAGVILSRRKRPRQQPRWRSRTRRSAGFQCTYPADRRSLLVSFDKFNGGLSSVLGPLQAPGERRGLGEARKAWASLTTIFVWSLFVFCLLYSGLLCCLVRAPCQ